LLLSLPLQLPPELLHASGHSFFHAPFQQYVCHFLPGCSGIIYDTRNVLVFPKLADGFFYLRRFFLNKLPEHAMELTGLKITVL